MDILKGKVSPLRQAYLRWRSLRNVPLRKKYFVGYDLDGNTFWEMYDYNNPYRPRRMVEYHDKKANLVDVKLPPQWIQWLKHTRPHTPTLEELIADVRRQESLKELVRAADQRWREIPLKSATKEEAKSPDTIQSKPTFEQPMTASGKEEFQPEGWNPSAKR